MSGNVKLNLPSGGSVTLSAGDSASNTTVTLPNLNTSLAPATSGSSILSGDGAGGFSNVTVGSGLSFSAGTLSAASVPQASRGAIAAGIVSTTAASPTSTGLAATVTPQSTGNKVLINVNICGIQPNYTGNGVNPIFYLYRGGTQIATFQAGLRPSSSVPIPVTFSYLDSPATTSATTYTLYFATNIATATVSFNAAGLNGNPTSDISLIEVR